MIEKLLTEWGAKQNCLPENNQILKNKIMASLAPSPAKIPAASRRLPLLPFAFAMAGVVGFIIVGLTSITPQNKTVISSQATSYNSALAETNMAKGSVSNSLVSQNSFMPPAEEITINDNRELLKTDYSASILSIHVPELGQKIQTVVRGFSGRIDSYSSTESSSYISFVIPFNHLDAFKEQVKDLAGEKFYQENLQSQNLLPQQVSIEQQQAGFTARLDELKTQKEQLDVAHQITANFLQSQINSTNKQIKTTQDALANDPNNQQLQKQVGDLQNQNTALKKQLLQENNAYSSESNAISNENNTIQKNLQDLSTQTGQLINSAATVRGNIQISHISRFAVTNAYLTPFWLPTLLLVLALIFYYSHTRKNRLVIPL